MRRTTRPSSRRTRTGLALSVLTALSVAALGACADSGAPDDGGSTRAAAPEKKAPDPAAELKSAVLTEGDVSGFKVRKPDQEYAFATSRDRIKVDKAACAPLAYAMNQFAPGTAEAEVTRVAAPGGKSVGSFTYITLAAYADGAAKSTLAEVTKAVGTCAGGFTAKSGGSSSAYDTIAREPGTAPSGTDGATAFRATTKYQGVTHTMRTRLVRHGDTLAVYFAVDGMAFTQGRPGDAGVAPAVVKAQGAKLK
ncbi:hypothetical protein [Streptomyces sp. NPDC047123]|uniref:hypothetical protein n=1 Tax=Streptomyces sp. NPDC047123 TaxID=3155622 RepID=UPI0033DD2417